MENLKNWIPTYELEDLGLKKRDALKNFKEELVTVDGVTVYKIIPPEGNALEVEVDISEKTETPYDGRWIFSEQINIYGNFTERLLGGDSGFLSDIKLFEDRIVSWFDENEGSIDQVLSFGPKGYAKFKEMSRPEMRIEGVEYLSDSVCEVKDGTLKVEVLGYKFTIIRQ